MATLNISIPDPMCDWIDAQVKAGEYSNVSDYMRDLIRHNQRQRDALNLALIEAEQSGISERNVTDIMSNLKTKLKDG